jgi:integrase
MKLSVVSRKEINSVLETVAARTPSTAARLYDDLKAMFLFAVRRGDLQVNPLGSEGNGGLKRPRGGKPRERVLSDAEIRTLWYRLPEVFAARPEAVAAIRLALVTAQRIGEVCGMTAGEIEGRVWTIPASRSKNKHAHAVPLSELALSLIKEAKAAAAARGSTVFFNLKPARISGAINVANDSFQIGALDLSRPQEDGCNRHGQVGIALRIARPESQVGNKTGRHQSALCPL